MVLRDTNPVFAIMRLSVTANSVVLYLIHAARNKRSPRPKNGRRRTPMIMSGARDHLLTLARYRRVSSDIRLLSTYEVIFFFLATVKYHDDPA